MKTFMIYECPRDPEHTLSGLVGESAPCCTFCPASGPLDMKPIEVVSLKRYRKLAKRIGLKDEEIVALREGIRRGLMVQDRYDDLMLGLVVWTAAKEGEWTAHDESLTRWLRDGGHRLGP